jgi:RinA family phage transcriptional activator
MRLSKAVFRYIEHELYNLEATKKEIAELKEDIINETVISDVRVSGGELSDTTCKRAMKLMTSKVLARMTKTVSTLERTLAKLSGEHRMIYELKYCQGKDWEIVCETIPISRTTYFRMRQEMIILAAQELGLALT